MRGGRAPAVRAGLRAGDLLLALNGGRFSDADRLDRLLARAPQGEPLELELLLGLRVELMPETT